MSAANEDPGARVARMRSIWIVHGGMLIFSLGFSIILTGVYPYMKQVRSRHNRPTVIWEIAL